MSAMDLGLLHKKLSKEKRDGRQYKFPFSTLLLISIFLPHRLLNHPDLKVRPERSRKAHGRKKHES
jgi:hypothetical protein